MRVVTNFALIKRNRQISQISFFASMGILVAFFLISLTNKNSDLAFLFNCVLTPLIFLGILYAVRMSNNWIREPVPWTALEDALKGLSTDSILYHYIFPARHVLINPRGVFAIYPIVIDRPVVVEDDHWAMTGGFGGALLAFLRQENVGNPTRDAEKEASKAQDFINKHVPNNTVVVEPIIVFTSPNAKVEVRGEQTVPVTFAMSKQNPGLKDYIKSIKEGEFETLLPEQIEVLDNVLIYQ